MSRYYAKLRGRMMEMGVDAQMLANELKIGYSTLSCRMNNKLDWTLTECYQVLDFLYVDRTEIAEYFPYHGIPWENQLKTRIKKR